MGAGAARPSAGQPLRVRIYVEALALLALGVTLVVAFTGSPRQSTASLRTGLLLVALICAGHTLRVRYQYRHHLEEINLLEAAVAPAILALAPFHVGVAAAAAVVLSGAVARQQPIKVVFNASQWLLAAVAASIAFDRLHAAPVTARSALPALIAALVVAVLVNQLFFGLLSWLASGRFLGLSGEADGRGAITARLLSAVASVSLGGMFAGAFLWTPAALVLAFLPMAMLHWASKGYAAVRADGMRLSGLQRATHGLAASLDQRQAVAGFLAEVRAAFEVDSVELVLVDDDLDPLVHTCDGRVSDGYAVDRRAHPLAAQLIGLQGPARVTAKTGSEADRRALEAEGHASTVAAPLISNGRVRGLLFMHDRVGMEGFEDGELAVAAALAGELVGFLQRSDLIRAVLDERRKLAEIVESTGDGILTIDDAGVVRSWNPALTAITGHGPEDMVGRRTIGVLRTRDAAGADVLLDRWAGLPDGLPPEVQVITASGDAVWLSCSYSIVPAAEGRNSTLVVVARNVTQARELERLKEDFVAVVSHELRTPLVGIRGWTQTLLTRGDRLTEEQTQQALQAMLRQAQRLEQLVLNILETSRIEAQTGGSGQELVDVGACVNKVVDEVVAARPDRVVRLRQPARPCHVTGSAVWIERAVANLVGNAVKYSPDDQPVDATVACEDGEVVVRVTDRGPGIAKEDRERVFERFERLEETATQTGTGLGLYIARQLVRAMGGTVTVDSVPGAGSTFSLRLPVSQSRLPEQRVGAASTVVLS